MTVAMRPPCDEAIILAGPATAPCERRLGPWIMAATILGSSMVFIDSTVVNIALPALQDALGATAADAQWIVESYALLFAAASALCGLAVDVGQLIAARGGTVVHVQDGFEKG